MPASLSQLGVLAEAVRSRQNNEEGGRGLPYWNSLAQSLSVGTGVAALLTVVRPIVLTLWRTRLRGLH